MPKTYTPEEINQAKSELKLALTDHKATVKNLGLSQKAVDKAVKVVQKAYKENKSIRQAVCELQVMTPEAFDAAVKALWE